MKTTRLLGAGLCVVVGLTLTWQVKAQEAGDGAAAEAVAPAPSGDQGEVGAMAYSNEGLAQWLAMNAPGEHHAKLESFVGSFDLACKYWMAPGLPPQEQTGTSRIKWILDGRFIQEDYSSQMGMPGMEPQPFKGFGLTGYDNMKKQYVGVWSDTMSTGFVQTTGQFNDETGTLEMTSSFDDPMTGQPTTMRVAYKVVDENTNVMKAYSPLPGGGEYQCLEITYTRKP